MKHFAWLLTLVLVVGCARSSSQPATAPVAASGSAPISAPTVEAKPAPGTTSPATPGLDSAPETVGPNDPLFDKIKASRYAVTLHSSTQKTGQVYLYAADERNEVTDAPWCGANKGDTVRTGHYGVYLAAEGGLGLVRQPVTLYPDMLLQFNDKRQYLQVVPGGSSGHPDLLALWQYGSCSMDAVALLGLSQDGQSLTPYRFKRADGTTLPSVGSKGLEEPAPGQLRTTSYNNAKGETTITTWAVRESEALLEAIKTEVKGRQ